MSVASTGALLTLDNNYRIPIIAMVAISTAYRTTDLIPERISNVYHTFQFPILMSASALSTPFAFDKWPKFALIAFSLSRYPPPKNATKLFTELIVALWIVTQRTVCFFKDEQKRAEEEIALLRDYMISYEKFKTSLEAYLKEHNTVIDISHKRAMFILFICTNYLFSSILKEGRIEALHEIILFSMYNSFDIDFAENLTEFLKKPGNIDKLKAFATWVLENVPEQLPTRQEKNLLESIRDCDNHDEITTYFQKQNSS